MDASELIEKLGGTTAVAALCKVRPPSVSEWRTNNCIPGERLLRLAPIAEAKGIVSRKELFPNDWQDIWPELAITTQQLDPPQTPGELIVAPPRPAATEVEDDAPAQPMDLAGQCDNNRRATPEADAGNGPCLQPPDIDGESEGAPPPMPLGLAADAANGQPVPPPGFSGQDENGSPAVPLCDGDDSQPLLVLDDEAGKAV